MNKYTNLSELQKDINEDNFELKTIHPLSLHNMVYNIPFPERINALLIIHEHQEKEIKDITTNLEIRMNEDLQEQKETTIKLINHLKETLGTIQSRLPLINKLVALYEDQETLPFVKNKSYKVMDWDNSVFDDSGQDASDTVSKKAKVIENSKFLNAYHEFILGIKCEPFPKDETDIPYILVQPCYGSFKQYDLYIRSDKLIVD